MSATAPHELIDVDALRIGMVVHLEGGWMAHPFPLSRFKIVTPEQIATIRSLGLKRVRWEPQSSDGVNAPGAADAGVNPAKGKPPAAGTHSANGASAPAPAAAAAAAATEPLEAQARNAHRKALAHQRDALQLCERQFAEAASACGDLTGLVSAKPLEAGARPRLCRKRWWARCWVSRKFASSC